MVKEEIKREIKKYFELNKNGNNVPIHGMQQKQYEKFIVISAYIKKKVLNLTFNLKKPEKEQIKPKVSREKREIKIRAERNKIEDRKTI